MNIEKMVRIAKNKSLLKEYKSSNNSRTVYLNDGEEFQIQLYNPYDYTISAKITLNGTEIPNVLVLRPAERVWLDRYLDTPRKFKFETYEVDNDKNTEKITAYNGLIKVSFYREIPRTGNQFNIHDYDEIRVRNPYGVVDSLTPGIYDCTTLQNSNKTFEPKTIIHNYYNSTSSCSCASSCTYNTTTNVLQASASTTPNSIETGRIAEGSYSNQKLDKVDLEFSPWSCNTETIKILPLSCKPFSSNDLKKQYCPSCGYKVNDKYKFCPYCGKNLKEY